MNVRVLHVLPMLAGGAPRAAIDLVGKQQSTRGMEARLCVLGDATGGAGPMELDPPPRFLDCPIHRRATAWRRWRGLRALIRETRPAIVHSHLWPAAASVARSGAGLPFAHVVHVQDTPPAFAAIGLRARVRTALLRAQLAARPATYLAVSEAARDYTVRHLGLDDRRFRIVRNGIDVARFPMASAPARTDGAFTVGAVGRLVREKGHELLLRAVAELVRVGMDVRLRIAGEGSRREELLRLSGELGLGERFELPGLLDDMGQFYAGLDAFALPSLSSEGLPLALLEAMASGCPVVASDCAGVREVVASPGQGIVVPVGDVQALAKALGDLAAQPDLRRELAAGGRERVLTEFDTARVAREVAAVYRELLG